MVSVKIVLFWNFDRVIPAVMIPQDEPFSSNCFRVTHTTVHTEGVRALWQIELFFALHEIWSEKFTAILIKQREKIKEQHNSL